ncbi:MAG: AIM24 family protein, partial [Dehalococcoidia bacterium]|nr:AIM24 family protein [Dehalococcoidia bacterium]
RFAQGDIFACSQPLGGRAAGVHVSGGALKSTLLGGEGLVCKLTGPGRFYLQTRNPDSFLQWLAPKLPGKRQ